MIVKWLKFKGIKQYWYAVLLLLFFNAIFVYHFKELTDFTEVPIWSFVMFVLILIYVNIFLSLHMIDSFKKWKMKQNKNGRRNSLH